MTLDFRALFEAAPGCYLVLAPDAPRYTIVAASDAYLRVVDAERSALLGRGIFEAFPDDAADATATGVENLRASLDRVVATRAADTMAVQKYSVQRGAGGGFEVDYWSPVNSPVLDANGEIAYVIHRVEEVTDFALQREQELRDGTVSAAGEVYRRGQQLQEANRQLRLLNERIAAMGELQLRALFDFMPQLGWTARADGFIDFYNRGWYDYTGKTFAEMQGWGWKIVHSPEFVDEVAARWQRSLDTGTPFEMEFPLRRHDGELRWFLTRVSPMLGPDGSIVRWVGINTDIHDRRTAGAQNELRLRLLIESIHDYAIFMLDIDGIVSSWNRGAERIKGYHAEEIIGRPFSVFYPEEEVRAGKCAHELAGAARDGRFEDEGWRIRKDGSRFWANVIISAVHDEGGRLIGFAKVTRDLTERRASEQERLRLIQTEEALRLRDEFLAIASHELRTPLTSLQLELHSIGRRASELDDKIAVKLERALRSGDRLTALVEMLLDVSRISSGRLTLRVERFDLALLARELCERFADQAARAGCEVRFHADAAGVVGTWDRIRIEQVISNLVGNAIKYAAGAPVDIGVDHVDGQAQLRVTDQGPGIPSDDQARIFGRFERAASIKHFGGLGLGLYIARQIVEAHGGTIEVHSERGKGASFTVRLPTATPGLHAVAHSGDGGRG